MQKKIAVPVLIFTLALFIGTNGAGNFSLGDINVIDEGQFAAWANHMLHGKYMYEDIYITYGPLFVHPLYILFKFFGPSAFLVRLYLTVGGAVGIIASYYLMREMALRKLVITGVLLVMLFVPVLNLRESFAIIALFALLKAHTLRFPLLYSLVGALSLITFLVSPDFGVFILLISYLYFLITFITAKDIKKRVIDASYYMLGVIFACAIFVYWSVREGWFESYVHTTANVITTISGVNVPNGMAFPSLIDMIKESAANLTIAPLLTVEAMLYLSLVIYFVSLFYIVASLFIQRRSSRVYQLFFVTLLGLMVYSVLLTRHGVGHFFYTLPLNLVICGFFLNTLYRSRKKHASYITFFLSTVIILYFARILYINNPTIIKILNPHTYLNLNYNNPEKIGLLNISEEQKNKIYFYQNFIKSNTSYDDSVFFYNDQPIMYMLVDRMNPTNYDLPFIANTLEKRKELIESFKKNRPLYVFIDHDAWAVDGINNISRLPELYSYIQKNYIKETVMSNVEIYRLK